MKDSPEGKGAFAFHLSKEKLMEFRKLSAKEKLDWLEEANKFVADFVPEAKLKRWKKFVDSQGSANSKKTLT